MDIEIQAVPVLKDNYAWLLHSEAGGTIVVDPGQSEPVRKVLGDRRLDAILLTHYHSDHTAGADALKQAYGAMIYGPDNVAASVDTAVKGGEQLTFAGVKIDVLSTPGHAEGHVSYVQPDVPALFTGDVLFSGGCGRLFDGTAAEMFASLRLYDPLPDNTLVCAGHEYTEANLAFIAAHTAQPNDAFQQRYREVKALRKQGKPTLPVALKVERETNPFLQARTVEELAHWRHLKDQA